MPDEATKNYILLFICPSFRANQGTAHFKGYHRLNDKPPSARESLIFLDFVTQIVIHPED